MAAVCPVCGASPAAVSARGCPTAPALFLCIADALLGLDHRCLLLVEGAPKDSLAGALELLPAYVAYGGDRKGGVLLGPAGARA